MKLAVWLTPAMLGYFGALLLGCGANGTSQCGPKTCGGCCDTQGVCRTGASNASCGASGAVCVACSSGQACQGATCAAPNRGGDSGASSDSGQDAGTGDAGTPSYDGGTDGTDAGAPSSDGGGPFLTFAFTGDTRPATCDDLANYPQPVMAAIVAGMADAGVRFALDTGDHFKVCASGTDTVAQAQQSAQQQMQLYTQATGALGAPFYLTMGNHECWDNKNLCTISDPVLQTFMTFVTVQFQTATPYYTFDVPTQHGAATFVFVADTAWDSTEASWLDSTLTHGDSSTYTIIAKHVPANDSSFDNTAEMAVIAKHKYALLLDAHTHQYLHTGREVTLGLGGAPLVNTGDDYAYAVIQERANGQLLVSIWNATLGTVRDSFSVGPN